MKIWTSLRTYFFVAIVMIGVLTIITYSYISSQYFVTGIKSFTEWSMREIALSWQNGEFENNYVDRDKAYKLANYSIATDWTLVPSAVRKAFPEAQTSNKTYWSSLEREKENSTEEHTVVYHLGKFLLDDGNLLYISRDLDINDIPEDVRKSFEKSWSWIAYIAVISSTAYILLVYLVFRYASKPIRALRSWATNLNEDTISENSPDFKYEELNDLANLIQKSLLSVSSSLKREQELLSNCSHELRTPIAVISNNLELLEKIRPEKKPQEEQVICRMQRATKTMVDLTNTLLGLSQNKNFIVEIEPVDIHTLIEQLSEQLHYLLVGKPVTVTKTIPETTLQLPHLSAQILLNNVIRNAYQHTLTGHIEIVLHQNTVKIINDIKRCELSQHHEVGYGLGLKLCNKIADHWGWGFEVTSDEKIHQAIITFKQ